MSKNAGTKFHKPSDKSNDQNERGRELCSKSLRPPKPKEYVKIHDGDGSRKLIVPDRNPIDVPGIFPKSEFKRLKNQAHVVTLKDRVAMIEEAERKKNQLVAESEKRKEDLKKAQVLQKAKIGTKLSDVERDAKNKNLYLLQRSFELMQEQEDKVKEANGLILATKCRAIRNAQIAEKELIAKQMEEEERRLDDMMEQQRQKALLDEEERREKEELKKGRYITELTHQMKMNETDRMIEAEKIEEESRMIHKAFLELQKEEERRLEEKKELQQKVRDELNQANDELERFKQIKAEEERIAELRVKKFMQDKLEREQAREDELALVKDAKAREIQRLREQQQKSQDLQAAADEMNAMRIQEEVEREWRTKELEAAKKKKDNDASLKIEREKQIDDLRKAAAIRLARDEEDFHKVAKIQRAEYEKEMEKKEREKFERERHRKDLLKQINEKERERIMQQQERFNEGKVQRMEQEMKDRHVEEYLRTKIQKLREINVPESYIQDIENQLKLNK